MRRAIRFARRNVPLLAVTALLMAGAGCISAVRKTNQQLIDESLTPITVPIEAYKDSKTRLEDVEAARQAQREQIEEVDAQAPTP
jgi:hypothetical protein